MTKVYTLINTNDCAYLGIFSTQEKVDEFISLFPQELRKFLYVEKTTIDNPWSASFLPYLNEMKDSLEKEKKRKTEQTIEFNEKMIARMQKEINELKKGD